MNGPLGTRYFRTSGGRFVNRPYDSRQTYQHDSVAFAQATKRDGQAHPLRFGAYWACPSPLLIILSEDAGEVEGSLKAKAYNMQKHFVYTSTDQISFTALRFRMIAGKNERYFSGTRMSRQSDTSQ